MVENRNERIREVFLTARGLDAGQQSEFLDYQCGDDAELRTAVEKLLADETTVYVPETDSFVQGEPPPERIGKYRIIRILGEGGMGLVYLAEQESPIRRPVALKVIKLGMDTREVIARFEAERQALAMMDHPNIAKVFDAGSTEQGNPFFAMEYVNGVPITDFCDRHRLGTRDRLALFVPVCLAIQHAHQKGIIHRDVKPSNVLVTIHDRKAVPKVIDFGVAKAINQRLTEHAIFTEFGRLIGTPAYMSPEQAEMTGLNIDTTSDIYSLGVLLYEMLAGVLPFDPRDLLEAGLQRINQIIIESEPPKPSTRISSLGDEALGIAYRRHTEPAILERQVRGELDWITMRAMEKERTRRYQSALDFATDIERFLKQEPVQAGPPTRRYRLRKFLERNRTKVTTLTLVTLLLVAAAITTRAVSEKRFRDQKTLESQRAMNLGEAGLGQMIDARALAVNLEAELQKVELETETWVPVWERTEELALNDSLKATRLAADKFFNQAVLAFSSAIDIAPAGKGQYAARRALEELYWQRYQEGLEGGVAGLSTDLVKNLIESIGVGTYQQELAGSAKVQLRSEPPGADVYCFRYIEHDEQLLPIPYDPERGIVGKPFLRVEKIWRTDSPAFEVGDRFLAAGPESLRIRGDLARVLNRLGEDEEVTITVLRDGRDVDVAWVPFPADFYAERKSRNPNTPLEPGRVLSFYDQFGITFDGYPLDFSGACLLGATSSAGELEIDLPAGSYLLVLRKDGFADTRLSVTAPGFGGARSVELVQEADLPPGFVYVPEGQVAYGGDIGAFQSLERGVATVPGFFVSRLEITWAEYLEFLNDPEILARTLKDGDKKGWAQPLDDEVKEKFLARDKIIRQVQPDGSVKKIKEDKIRLIPRDRNWVWNDSTMAWSFTRERPDDWPVWDVPLFAAMEYAAWKSRKEGGRWRFRLPDDLEWERAARGTERRAYVWGDYFIRTFAWSADASYERRIPAPVGISPADESIFGVRDLAGSMSEITTTQPTLRYAYISRRGGHWDTTDEPEFRIATRNGLLPESGHTRAGFRLFANLGKGHSPG